VADASSSSCLFGRGDARGSREVFQLFDRRGDRRQLADLGGDALRDVGVAVIVEQCGHGVAQARGVGRPGLERDAGAELGDEPGVARLVGGIGSSAIGTPAASAASVVPVPPWVTRAAASRRTAAIATQRSTWTLGGSGPSAAGSASRPTVTRIRTGRPATASIASR
jgi:hypothetical protein